MGLRSRVTRRGGEQDGAVLVIVAGLLVVFMVLIAMALDLGSARQQQQRAQSAADAGALAAADAIAGGTTGAAATTAGQSMASVNDPGSTVSVTTSGNTATVGVSQNTQNGFGNAAGDSGQRVGAQATAVAGGTPSAIFAGSSNCSGTGLTLANSLVNVSGSVVSNGLLTENGLIGSIDGSQSYGCSGGYSHDFLPLYTISGTTTKGSSTNPYPLDYRTAYANPCTSANTGSYTSVGTAGLVTTINGIVCSTKPISVYGSYLTGTGTIIAPSITMYVSAGNFAPAWNNLEFWATTGNLSFAGALLDSGTVFAPAGTITITASAVSVTGFIEGNAVDIELNPSFTLQGNGPANGSGSSLTG